MLDKLTTADFAPYLGQIFPLLMEPPETIPLELVEVTARPRRGGLPSWLEAPVPLQPHPFSLVFRGPHSPALPQQLHTLQHPTLGLLEGIFLTPIAADTKGRYYEAIFN